MYALIIIFIIMVLLIGLFSIALVTREVVIEEKERRRRKNVPAVVEETEITPSVAVAQTVTTVTENTNTDVVQPTITENTNTDAAQTENTDTAETTATETQVGEGAVTFSAGSQTLDEKYLELSPEHKGYYDEIVRFAMAVENSKRYKNAAYEEYKVGKNRLVRLKIKRGIIICELVIPNLTFKNYISDNKVSVKQAPATIKVVDETSLSAVKDSIGIAVKAIQEEKDYKKEQARIRRRENRRATRETV